MTKEDFELLGEVLFASKKPYTLLCNTTWNGFEAGQRYQADLLTEARPLVVTAKDKDGIDTSLTRAFTFFDLMGVLPSKSELEDEHRGQTNALLSELTGNLLRPYKQYQPGDMVEFIPGMENFGDAKVFCVVKQMSPFQAFKDGNPFNSSQIEMLDLRVTYFHQTASGKRVCETHIDSRRVRRLGSV